MIRWWSIGLAAALGIVTSPALGQERDSVRAHSVVPNQDFHAIAGFGPFYGDSLEDGFMGAILATYRVGYVEVGGTVEGGSEIFGGSYSLAGFVLGPVWRTESGIRLELYGMFGEEAYSGVGCGLFCSGGGASATLPYAGARAGGSYAFGHHHGVHFELGGSVFYGTDLERRRVEYTTSGGLFDSSSVSHESMMLGGTRKGAMLTAGLVIDG